MIYYTIFNINFLYNIIYINKLNLFNHISIIYKFNEYKNKCSLALIKIFNSIYIKKSIIISNLIII